MSIRNRVDQVELSGPEITLGDLRWLVAQCEGMPDDSTVAVKGEHQLRPGDVEPAQIVVSGNRPPPRPPFQSPFPPGHNQPGVRGA